MTEIPEPDSARPAGAEEREGTAADEASDEREAEAARLVDPPWGYGVTDEIEHGCGEDWSKW